VSGVVVRVGESIQGKVDAHPAGTTFVIKAGVHKRQSVVPKAGNTFVGESGAVLSGENATSYAFGAKADNVTVKNLVIEKYAGPSNEAAIVTLGGADGWRIEGNEIRYNKGSGIRSGGKDWKIIGNYVHHNEVYGMTGTGSSGMVVEDNEIAFNNYQKTSGGNAGGSKWLYTSGLVVRNNFSHDNVGPGLWTDGHNRRVVYEGNRVVNNTGSGIKHEASCDAVIRNNTVEGNGFGSGEWMGGGIRVSLSPDVEVHHNVVTNNRNGITAVYSHRSYANTWCPGPDGQHQLKNLWVHDNTITMTTGQTGVIASAAADKVFGEWNNRFDRNTYTIGGTAKPFEWRGDRTTTEWKNYGHDPNSTWN
jgi:parallel beta-helix repeat protein